MWIGFRRFVIAVFVEYVSWKHGRARPKYAYTGVTQSIHGNIGPHVWPLRLPTGCAVVQSLGV